MHQAVACFLHSLGVVMAMLRRLLRSLHLVLQWVDTTLHQVYHPSSLDKVHRTVLGLLNIMLYRRTLLRIRVDITLATTTEAGRLKEVGDEWCKSPMLMSERDA